jgi:hypothetical protein
VDCADRKVNLKFPLALIWSSVWSTKGSIAEL